MDKFVKMDNEFVKMDSEFIKVTNEMLTYCRYWQPLIDLIDNNEKSKKGIILFGHQNMAHLEVIIRNILAMIRGSWKMTLICSKNNFVKTLQLCHFINRNINVAIKDQFFLKN